MAAVLGAITLLPALLGLLKHRIALGVAAGVPAPDRTKPGTGMWHRWAGVVRRHPVVVTRASSLAFLVPLIIPAFSLELGQEDIGATNPATTERQAYDLITAGFGVGYNGPLQVASELEPAGDAERRVHQEVQQGDVAAEGPGAGAEDAAEAAEAARAAAEAARGAAGVAAASRATS